MLAGVRCGRAPPEGRSPRTDGRWVRLRCTAWPEGSWWAGRRPADDRERGIKATVGFPLPAVRMGGSEGYSGQREAERFSERVNRSCLVELTVLTRGRDSATRQGPLARGARSLTRQLPGQDSPCPPVEPVQTSVRRGLCAVLVNTATRSHVGGPTAPKPKKATQKDREDGSV